MAGIPSGRTTSVKALEKTFILQTEFRLTPKPVIVTSVSLDGQIVHKVERSYSNPFDTQEELKAAEDAIVAQHEGLARKIIANGADFIRKTRAIRISKMDRLTVIPGVSFVTDINEKLSGANPPAVYVQSKLILDIADAISSTSRSGPFKVAAIISDRGKFIVDREDDSGYLVSLKQDAEIGTVLKEVQEG